MTSVISLAVILAIAWYCGESQYRREVRDAQHASARRAAARTWLPHMLPHYGEPESYDAYNRRKAAGGSEPRRRISPSKRSRP